MTPENALFCSVLLRAEAANRALKNDATEAERINIPLARQTIIFFPATTNVLIKVGAKIAVRLVAAAV